MTDIIREPGTGYYCISVPCVIDMEDVIKAEAIDIHSVNNTTGILKLTLKNPEIVFTCASAEQRDAELAGINRDIRKRNFKVITSEAK